MRAFILLTLLTAGVLPAAAQTAPPPGVRSCSGCHAPSRLGSAVPAFAGHSSDDIAIAMQEFRSGKRPSTVMGRIAKGFSDEEVKAIAIWLAAHPEKTQ